MPGTGEPQAAQAQAFPVAHDAPDAVLFPCLGPRGGSAGLMGAYPIDGESASVSCRGVGGGGNVCGGYGDCDDDDGLSLVQTGTLGFGWVGSGRP